MLANPIVLDNYRPKRELHKTPYQHFKDAEKHAQDASAPFATGMHLAPRHFWEAVTSLEAVKTSVLALRESLSETSSISTELAVKGVSIDGYIDTVIAQIEKHLIPSLNWNKSGDFSPLLTALSNIEASFPERERF